MKEFEPQFRQFVSRFVSLDETTWGAFFKDWKLVEFGRKETISRPGEVEDCLYFVVEGTQRIYYFDEENREATLVLTYPYSFAGVIDSFLLQSPSNYYFETITSSKLLVIRHGQLQKWMDQHPGIHQMVQQLVYLALSGILERMAELQSFSSEQKLRSLLARSPHVLQVVPHKYLANYLGIDPTNFSKLINTIKF